MTVHSFRQEFIPLINDYSLNGPTILKTLAQVPEPQLEFRKLRFTFPRHTPGASKPIDTTALRNDFSAAFPYVQKLHLHAEEVIYPEGHKPLLEVLPLFTNVTSLRISGWDFQKFEAGHLIDFLSHFGATVEVLKIDGCWANSAVLIFLTSLFPRVNDLWVDPRPIDDGADKLLQLESSDKKTYRVTGSATPLKVAGFRGKLTFILLEEQHEEFIEFVRNNSLGIESLHVHLWEESRELQKLINSERTKLESVGVLADRKELVGSIDLSSLDRLRNLSIRLLNNFGSDDPNWEVLKTVNSVYLEEIEIHPGAGELKNGWGGWRKIDNRLCELYDETCRNNVSSFHVSLDTEYIHSEDEWRQYLQAAWPKFIKDGGFIRFSRPLERGG